MIAAQQIASAMERKGLSKSQLAEIMGKNRSEITKWLSGRHNFTSDTLAELSQALGEEITGVSTLVQGYGAIYLDGKSYRQAVRNARKDGTDIATYIKSLIAKDSQEVIELPKVDFTRIPAGLARKYSACVNPVSVEEYQKDERFERIWNR